MLNRRALIKCLLLSPLVLPNIACALASTVSPKYLILIELKGGNDGLNTIIPYNDDLYYQKRPSLALAKNSILTINDEIGFHPALTGLSSLYQQRELAIIQNVGYQNPNLSHFASLDIWERASTTKARIGWLYDAFNRNPQASGIIDAIVLGGSTGLFVGPEPRFIKIRNVKSFVNGANILESGESNTGALNKSQQHLLKTKALILTTAEQLKKATSTNTIQPANKTQSRLSKQLHEAAVIIKSGFNVPVIKTSIGGFDTHAMQADTHNSLLLEVDEAITNFIKLLKKHGL